MVHPPSTGTITSLTKSASSETKNKAVLAIDDEEPMPSAPKKVVPP